MLKLDLAADLLGIGLRPRINTRLSGRRPNPLGGNPTATPRQGEWQLPCQNSVRHSIRQHDENTLLTIDPQRDLLPTLACDCHGPARV